MCVATFLRNSYSANARRMPFSRIDWSDCGEKVHVSMSAWLDYIKTRFESFVGFNPVAYVAAYLPSVYIEALEPPLINSL